MKKKWDENTKQQKHTQRALQSTLKGIMSKQQGTSDNEVLFFVFILLDFSSISTQCLI